MFAVEKGDRETAELLIRHGAGGRLDVADADPVLGESARGAADPGAGSRRGRTEAIIAAPRAPADWRATGPNRR